MPAHDFDNEDALLSYANGPVPQIETVEELISIFSRVIENEGPPEDLERVLDGVSRLCTGITPGFERLAVPLLKRAKAFVAKAASRYLSRYSVRLAFCDIAIAWLGGGINATTSNTRISRINMFLEARVREVAHRAVTKQPQILLALPTQRDGLIDPVVFVQRLKSSPNPSRYDFIQALLRLDVSSRLEALKAAESISGELGELTRHALGGDNVRIGTDTALWIAASRARDPLTVDSAVAGRHGVQGPDTTTPADINLSWSPQEYYIDDKSRFHHHAVLSVEPAVPPMVGLDFPTVLFHPMPSNVLLHEWEDFNTLWWASTVWPGYRESWFAVGCYMLGNNLDWFEARWVNRAYLIPLLNPGTGLTELGLSLLALGLASKETQEGALSRDIVITAISDGRLKSAKMSRLLSFIFLWDHITLPRVTDRLKAGAGVSVLHSLTIRNGLIGALEECPPVQLAPLGIALNLLYELSIHIPATTPSGKLLELLKRLRGENRAAAIAKKLMAKGHEP